MQLNICTSPTILESKLCIQPSRRVDFLCCTLFYSDCFYSGYLCCWVRLMSIQFIIDLNIKRICCTERNMSEWLLKAIQKGLAKNISTVFDKNITKLINTSSHISYTSSKTKRIVNNQKNQINSIKMIK